MSELIWIIFATFIVSSVSFVGAAVLVLSQTLLKKILLFLLALSAGTLIGGAFLHLLPEAIQSPGANLQNVFMLVIVGFTIFFVLEKLLWHRCYNRVCPIHTFAYLNLIGDGIHNFIDGLILAAAFVVGGVPLGITTMIAVAVHEIPQEISDFGVIVYGGIKPMRALFLNFATAVTAVAGGIIGYVFFPQPDGATTILLPVAAGGFLYIAAVDLVPELHKEPKTKKNVISFFSFLFGVGIMLALKVAFGGV